jgi:multiple sugar transport system substrate-binding protein
VQVEPVGSGDYYARILTQIAAGDPPDLLQIGDDAVPMFVDRGAFVPLDEFIAGADFPLDTGIYLPGVLEPGQWNGKQYLLPKDFSPLAVYYNKRLFDEAGCPIRRMAGRGMSSWPPRSVDPDRRRRQNVQWGVQLPGGLDDRL